MYFPSGQSGCFVEIEDHGTGMDEETKQMVFTPFFTTKEREKHMGLSLSQAFRVVKQQGGSILIESSPGIGTRVKVCLPLSEGRAVAPEESTSKMSRADATKILVVDDEENVRQLGHDVLTEHGFHVITANDGVHALQKVKENPDIRLVLMDMIMPVMNGKEACVEIKKLANPPKILICTGFSELSDLKTILGTCAEGMIEKPYKTTELIEAVENILKGTIL
jgi:CheY-like chemotaxis protein